MISVFKQSLDQMASFKLNKDSKVILYEYMHSVYLIFLL